MLQLLSRAVLGLPLHSGIIRPQVMIDYNAHSFMTFARVRHFGVSLLERQKHNLINFEFRKRGRRNWSLIGERLNEVTENLPTP